MLTIEEFHHVVIPMLITLGPGLHRDPVLMFKVVRIVRDALINVRVCIISIFFLKFYIIYSTIIIYVLYLFIYYLNICGCYV